MLCIYSLAKTDGIGYGCHHPGRSGGNCAVDNNGVPRRCGSVVAYPSMQPRRVSQGKYRFYDAHKRTSEGDVMPLVDVKVDHHGIFERVIIDPNVAPFSVEAIRNVLKLRDACNYAIALMGSESGRRPN